MISTLVTSWPILQAETIRLTSVLDFEGALAGDPLMDVAKALYHLSDLAKIALLEGYGDMGRRRWSQTLDLSPLFCARTLVLDGRNRK
jgi:aminoglycoside phosphotransferase (APT) family kinase protein